MQENQDIINKLMEERASAEERIMSLNKEDPFSDPDYANNNTPVDTDVHEQESHERIEAEIKTLRDKIDNINLAIERVKEGKYGICKRCGKVIDVRRLKLIPESVYCVSCENELVK